MKTLFKPKGVGDIASMNWFDSYETTPPEPIHFGTGWEFKRPEFGDAFFASDYPVRIMARGAWEPKEDSFGGKRWCKKMRMGQHTITFTEFSRTTVETCPTCGHTEIKSNDKMSFDGENYE